jgi:hypothetical protein
MLRLKTSLKKVLLNLEQHWLLCPTVLQIIMIHMQQIPPVPKERAGEPDNLLYHNNMRIRSTGFKLVC